MNKCPICGKEYSEAPAISRAPSGENICSECGQKQAIFSYQVMTRPKYQTRGISEWSKKNPDVLYFLINSMNRHIKLDWGDCCEEDAHTNDTAVAFDDRVFSVYKIPENLLDGVQDDKIWIITEWDRSGTTILFPSEY